MKLPRAEFERLALDQLDAVDRMAHSLTRSPAEAEDLVQETYLRAIRAADSFDLQSFGIRPWLLRILHNVYVSRGKRQRLQPKTLEAEQLDRAGSDQVDPLPQAVTNGEMDGMVVEALNKLNADSRAAVLMWAVDELTYREIAKVQSVPIGTVMSRLHRARKQLGESLASYARGRE